MIEVGDITYTKRVFRVLFLFLLSAFLFSITAFFTVENSFAEAGNVTLNASIDPVFSMYTNASDDTLPISVTPSPSGTFASNNIVVTVSTNNPTGYTLTMNSITNDTDLVNTIDSSAVIPSTAANIAFPTTLPINTWGFYPWTLEQVESPTSFSAIPPLSTPLTIRTTSEPMQTSNTTLTFATIIDNDVISGTYTNTVVFTAVNNYVPPYIPSMQGFTTAKCEALSDGEMLNLIDTRDGTYYRVKRMADDKCWMVDNLAFDLANANAPTYYNGNKATLISGTTTSVTSVPQYTLNSNLEGQIPNDGNPKASYLYNWCAVNVDQSQNCTATAGATINQYLNQTTPNVPGGTSITNGLANSQGNVTGICAAPFRLPHGGPDATSSDPSTTANEFAILDIAIGGNGASNTGPTTLPFWTGSTTANTDWLGVTSGIYLGMLLDSGNGSWWSSTASSATNSYYMYLYPTNTYVHPATSTLRGYGFAVRCVL